MVGSLEFCTGKLGSRLILVLGHTKCGAIYGATKTYLDSQPGKKAGVLQPHLTKIKSDKQRLSRMLFCPFLFDIYINKGGTWQHMATLEVAGCALEGLLQDLGSVAQEAAQELGPGASSDEVAAHAVKAG